MAAADEQLRQEIGSERKELTLALDSLHAEIRRTKRRIPKLVAGAVAAIVAVKLLRRALK